MAPTASIASIRKVLSPESRWDAQAALVAGAAIRFDGQLMVFDLRKDDSPCYACLFAEDDGEMEELRCAVMGVFASLTGIIGAMQAMEAIKLVAEVGSPLSGLMIFDAKKAEWRTVRVKKDPGCAVCR